MDQYRIFPRIFICFLGYFEAQNFFDVKFNKFKPYHFETEIFIVVVVVVVVVTVTV